ncbi:magnesium protoporphyrin IX methyltransferase [Roseovarius sp. D22-M7]|uniref:magnesium protoporphyrin IX methyltransferase n=1 Tax=Roseovarius sp. D22-M7 TaxID=3127116 RepID=UPI0030101EF0
MTYDRTLSRVETYFDKTATRTWERLTSDAPVSRIRGSVRVGRDRMRAQILSRLPADLTGLRVLDAGCGTGQMTEALALRGADVLAVDISPSLVDVARARLPRHLQRRVSFHAGDMLEAGLGTVDHVVAMDSLIYYAQPDLTRALAGLADRTRGKIIFTVAPRTPLLMAMWQVGKLFPRADRSPTMVPHAPGALAHALRSTPVEARLVALDRINSGFYISQAMELAR